MAYIMNADDTIGNKDNNFIDDNNINDDTSTMDRSIEDNYSNIQKIAVDSLKSRKPIYNFKTKNTSFLELYNDLYKMGIKNNKFFLKLYDTDLLGVDVYSPIMPKDLQLKIILECFINPWYFVREVARIPAVGKPIEVGGGVPFNIDRNSLASWYLFLNGIDHYVSKPRQRGKTQNAICQFNYSFHFGTLASQILFFNKDEGQSIENLYRLKDQRDMLPTWMQMRSFVTDDGKIDKGRDNVKSYLCPVTKNSIKVMPKAISQSSAQKLGRGATTPLQYYDEFDFIPYNTEIIKAASFAYATASKSAKASSSTTCRVFSSTPGDLDNVDGNNAADFVHRMIKWDDHMLDDPIEKLRTALRSDKCNGIVYVEHTWRQLKLPMSWYEEQCRLVDYDQITIMREIDLQRIHGSNTSPFKRSDILYIMNHKKTPLERIDLSQNYCPFIIYEKIKPNIPYILSIDPSDGLALDNNAVTMINPYTQLPVMEFQSPYVSQPQLCKMLIKFMDTYCPKCMILIESNKGIELINRFMETKYKYQLYYDDNKMMKNIDERVNKYGDIVRQANERRAYGLSTSRANRPKYDAILENLMLERKECLCTEYIVTDVCGLIRTASGKVEAGKGSHDDNIISYLMGLFVYYHAPAELLERYGIQRGAVDPNTYYDENGNMTEEAQLDRLREMLPGLPDELQEIIKGTLDQKDEVKESWDYYKEVQKYEAQDYFNNPINGNLRIDYSQAPNDQAFWQAFDDNVYQSNFDEDKKEDEFDINDYF
jgi:hypothetical protein